MGSTIGAPRRGPNRPNTTVQPSTTPVGGAPVGGHHAQVVTPVGDTPVGGHEGLHPGTFSQGWWKGTRR